MKKKIIFAFILSSIITIMLINLSFSPICSNSRIDLYKLTSLVFADAEQPNTDDCIDDENRACEALHPTDPSKDDVRENAIWPEN
jgi:hypothetical protein